MTLECACLQPARVQIHDFMPGYELERWFFFLGPVL